MVTHDITTETLTGEVWNKVPGLDGLISASSMGRIRTAGRYLVHNGKISRRYVAGRIVKQYPARGGYLFVRINGKSHFVHRLVRSAFYGPILPGLVVNHIDHDKKNNAWSNLDAVTQRDNIIASVNHYKLHGETSPVAKLKVEGVARMCDLLLEGVPQKDIALEFGISRQTVGLIANARIWKRLPIVHKTAKALRKRERLADRQRASSARKELVKEKVLAVRLHAKNMVMSFLR